MVCRYIFCGMGCWLLPGVAAALNLSLKPPAPQLLEPQHNFSNYLKHMAPMIFDQKMIRFGGCGCGGFRHQWILAAASIKSLHAFEEEDLLRQMGRFRINYMCFTKVNILLSENTSPPSHWYVICLVSNGPLVIYNVCFHKRKEVQ